MSRRLFPRRRGTRLPIRFAVFICGFIFCDLLAKMREIRGKSCKELRRFMRAKASLFIFLTLSMAPGLRAQQVPVQEYALQNGMKLLMVPRKGDPNIAAGWVAKVGSVNERPGITGISHLFEHMMFKGTHAIGTTDIKKDLEIMARMDAVKAELRKEEEEQIRKLRLGEIDYLKDPKNRNARHQELLKQLAELEKKQKDLLIKNEFDKIY